MKKWIVAALFLSFVLPVNAQESGALTGEFDGTAVSFELMPSQTDHRGNPDFGSVSMAFKMDIEGSDLKIFFIGFNLMGGKAETPEARMSITRVDSFVARPDETFSVVVQEASKQDDLLFLKGTISLNADFSNDFGRTLDASRSHAFEGAFEAKVGGL
ncbi:hypothetical protein SAMN05444000_13419 [Shimia gijangensis]|uniref:Lipid/polyisoprenoid-binding YceI-like domain-containing protein n=1 Tax=Shimia gijangensis TaxID=1470563 RepID=A0A1M6T2G7_9RHOB|nr:hypothetical protein [Shimia gijangensis]SHK51182.1 hypothetical protein SAMN05444000_13419 [Shimia gijangensis]